MRIKWSAVKVSKAMDEVEAQLTLAESFFTEAKTLAVEARKLPNLPQYMSEKLDNLAGELGYRIESLKRQVDSIREHLPEGAVKAEQEGLKHGSQQSLV